MGLLLLWVFIIQQLWGPPAVWPQDVHHPILAPPQPIEARASQIWPCGVAITAQVHFQIPVVQTTGFIKCLEGEGTQASVSSDFPFTAPDLTS